MFVAGVERFGAEYAGGEDDGFDVEGGGFCAERFDHA